MKIKSITFVFMLLAIYAVDAFGQTSSSGMFGSRTVGSPTSSMGSSFTGSSMGSTGMGSMGTGSMGMGSTGMGSTGMGSSGMGMSGIGSTSMGNQQTGQFIGANTGQTAFVGGGQLGQTQSGRTSGQYGQFGQTSSQYGQFGNTRAGNQNRTNQQNLNQGRAGGQNNRNQVQLPTVRRVDFEYQKISMGNVSSDLTRSLRKIPQFRAGLPVEASFQGDTLVLKGVVSTAHDRELAERLARLEPGIDQIQNDLVVQKAEIPDSQGSPQK